MPGDRVHPGRAPAGVTSLSRWIHSTGRRFASSLCALDGATGVSHHSSRMFCRKINMSVRPLLFTSKSLHRDWANKKRGSDRVSCQANQSDAISMTTNLLSPCFVLPAAVPGKEGVCGQVCDFLFVWQHGSYFSSYFILDRIGSSNHDHKIKMFWCFIR